MDRYRLGPCPGPSAQWQFCRPQRLYVSTNVPRRTCSIGGKSRTIRRRRLRSAGEERFWMSVGPNHMSVRMNESKSDSSVNLGSVLGEGSEEFSKRDQAKGVDEQRNGTARSLPRPEAPSRSSHVALRVSRGRRAAGSASRFPRHGEPSKRRTAARAMDETDA
jgi:hypothetical protein